MRISDWSSDVCSSDLTAVATADLPTGAMTLGLRPECIRPAALDGAPLAARVQVVERLGERTLPHVVLDDGTDRKSVVEGKSVSVRVDLGGRRIIKKKKQQQNKSSHTNKLTIKN